MAVGKNLRISRGKKGGKKKVVDPFARIGWYDMIKSPSMFTSRNSGRTQGTKIRSEGINLKQFQVCLLADRFTSDFKKLVAKLIEEMFGKEIEKATSGIYPLQNALIHKAKFDNGKLIYGGSRRLCRR